MDVGLYVGDSYVDSFGGSIIFGYNIGFGGVDVGFDIFDLMFGKVNKVVECFFYESWVGRCWGWIIWVY